MHVAPGEGHETSLWEMRKVSDGMTKIVFELTT
jgi:hypothetical protein